MTKLIMDFIHQLHDVSECLLHELLSPVVLEQLFVFQLVVNFFVEITFEPEGGLFSGNLLSAGDGLVLIRKSILDEAGFGSHWRVVTKEVLVTF